MTYKVAVLDFDGVILESAEIKTQAFRQLFSAFPDHVEAIIDHHVKNAGISRYRKFAAIYQNILHLPLQRTDSEILGRRFSELALQKVKKAPFVHGTLEFLQEYCRNLRFFIASGTPEDELKEVVKIRGLDSYFVRAYGAPASKAEILKDIITAEGIDADEALFVGDALSDYEAAKETAVAFIGRASNCGTAKVFKELNVRTVSDMRELATLLRSKVVW